ncbi:unnamed protein product [Brassica oleracea]
MALLKNFNGGFKRRFNRIDTFWRNVSGDDLRPWINRMENRFAAEAFKDDQKMVLAYTVIRGEAESWYNNRELSALKNIHMQRNKMGLAPKSWMFKFKGHLEKKRRLDVQYAYHDVKEIVLTRTEINMLVPSFACVDDRHVFHVAELTQTSMGNTIMPFARQLFTLMALRIQRKMKYPKSWKFKFKKSSWRRVWIAMQYVGTGEEGCYGTVLVCASCNQAISFVCSGP